MNVTSRSLVFVAVCVVLFVAPVVPAQNEQAQLIADDASPANLFGRAVAVSGETAVVGSLNSDPGPSESGSVYVFVRSGTSWSQQAKLMADDATVGDLFGNAVAIDGDTLVVGAWADDNAGGMNAGSVYVFVRSGTVWSQQAKLISDDGAPSDLFGGSVSVSGDTLLVGVQSDDDAGGGSGSAYVFVRSGTNWSQQAKLTADDAAAVDLFGEAVSLSGDTALIGSHKDDDLGVDSGSAYVFVRSGTSWMQQAKLLPSDGAAGHHFAEAVAMHGETAVVGSVHISNDAGAAYVYVRSGTSWSQEAKLTANDPSDLDLFGFAVAFEEQTAVIGSWLDDDLGINSGSAYVFVRNGTSWALERKIIASNGSLLDQFGIMVAVSAGSAVIGAHQNDQSGNNSGLAYVFDVSYWSDLGGGTTGINGQPSLLVYGPLSAGSEISIELTQAPSGALMLFRASLASSPVFAVGGTLYPQPFDLQTLLVADAGGSFSLTAPVAPGLPVGQEFFFQFIVQDLSVAHTITLSNARMSTSP